MAKICPMYLNAFMNGIYYYAAYECPLMNNGTVMSSPTRLTTGCSSPHCQTSTAAKSTMVADTMYVGFPGDPCLPTGLDPCMGWPEVKGITEHLQTDDCRFKIPEETGIPGGGEVVCARLFTVRVRIANGNFIEIKVGQEMNNHPSVANEKEFPLDAAEVKSVGKPFLFEVKYKSQLYSVLTTHRQDAQ